MCNVCKTQGHFVRGFFSKEFVIFTLASDGCFAFRQRFGSFSAALAACEGPCVVVLRPLFFTNKHVKGESFFRKNVKKRKIKEDFVSKFTKNSIKNIHPSVPILRISQQMRIIEKCATTTTTKIIVGDSFLSVEHRVNSTRICEYGTKFAKKCQDRNRLCVFKQESEIYSYLNFIDILWYEGDETSAGIPQFDHNS